jgi:acyl-CoA hydrolase
MPLLHLGPEIVEGKSPQTKSWSMEIKLDVHSKKQDFKNICKVKQMTFSAILKKL